MGRACELAKTNVILSPTANDYTCTDGVYVSASGSEFSYARELGRAMAHGLGFNNSGPAPASWNATGSGIPLAALQAGNTLFASGFPLNCPDATGCLGFIGTSFEFEGREQAFAVAVQSFVKSAESFRLRAAQQRAAVPCSDLLSRKYDWIRTHIYGGAEFREAADTSPAVAFCP